MGEPCNLFLLSIITARNYDAYFALPGDNKSVIESSINLIKQYFLVFQNSVSPNYGHSLLLVGLF